MTEYKETARSNEHETAHSVDPSLAEFSECLPTPAALLTPNLHIQYANKAFAKILGIQAQRDVYKKLPSRWFADPEEALAQLHSLCQAATQGGDAPKPVRLSLRSANASEIPVEVHARPWNKGLENPSNLLVVTFLKLARNVTELGRIEDELKRSEERFRILFEYAPDGYYLCDLKGRFIDGNRAAERISGYRRKELIGRSFLELNLLSKGSLPKAAALLAKNVLGKATGPAKFVLYQKNGQEIPIEVSTYPITIQGETLVLGIARDITERIQAEAAVEKLNRDLEAAVDDLNRSNKELQEFAHIAAHDLKAPLRGITNLAEWLSQDYGDQIGEEGRENLHLLHKQVCCMTKLIDGILHYSKIGRPGESVEMLDTHTLVEDVIEMIAPPENVDIRIEDRLPPVRMEQTRLTQVFQNLIGNAVKYLDEPNGRIRIGAVADGNSWRFHISDNGPGIEAKHFERIFDVFHTLSTSDRGDGTGLGLAVVKKTVELGGGRVWVESHVGRGSTFFFTLPRHNPPDAGAENPAQSHSLLREDRRLTYP